MVKRAKITLGTDKSREKPPAQSIAENEKIPKQQSQLTDTDKSKPEKKDKIKSTVIVKSLIFVGLTIVSLIIFKRKII